MKKLIIISAAVLSAASLFAQERPQRINGSDGAERQMPRSGMMPMHEADGMWILRMFSNKAILTKLGVTDEAVLKKIQDGLGALKKRNADLSKKIRDASRAQTKLIHELLTDKSIATKAATDNVEELARLRAEQGRLAIEAVVLLHENLTDEQMKKMRRLVAERGRARERVRTEAKPEVISPSDSRP